MVPGLNNLQAHRLVAGSKMALPPLHITLGIMKQIGKALDKVRDCFRYISTKISRTEKKTGVYDCSQIRKFINDLAFPTPVNEKEFSVWNALWKLSKTFGEIEKCPTTMRL